MMKRVGVLFVMVFFVLCVSGTAVASIYTVTTEPDTVDDLLAQYLYIWPIDCPVPAGESVTAATLECKGMHTHNNILDNTLWVDLVGYWPGPLDEVTPFFSLFNTPFDGFSALLPFRMLFPVSDGTPILTYSMALTSFEDLPMEHTDQPIYDFTSEQVSFLNYLIDSGMCFGLGFDADCLSLGGDEMIVLLQVNGDPVPEPSTMLLLGAGLVALAGARRKSLKK